jgi:mannose-6-phosphate isomerase-like protein (cupin superfamily)
MNQPSSRVAYSTGETGERPWGRWSVVDVGEGYAVKRIEVEPGARLSLQFHHHRSEHWIVVQGTGQVWVSGNESRAIPGCYIHIPVEAEHRIHNTGPQPLIFIEVQMGAQLDEADIVRSEDDYDRTAEPAGQIP